MLDRVEFLIGEALVAMRRNGLMTFAAVSTVAVSLFLLGGLGYVYLRVTDYANTLPGKFEMRVFLKDGTTMDQIRRTAEDIRDIDGVATCNWIPRDKAWQRLQKENPGLTEGLENPLPDAFKVTVKDLSTSDQVVESIRLLPAVEPVNGVSYLKDDQQFVDQALRLIRWLGSVFGGLLFLTGGVLIYNAIRLTILSRRLEIRIMQLVGASHLMVRVPFYIEGMLQGALGGVIATFMVLAGNQLVIRFVQSLKTDVAAPSFPLGLCLGSLTFVGAVYGLACSLLAFRSPLRFR